MHIFKLVVLLIGHFHFIQPKKTDAETPVDTPEVSPSAEESAVKLEMSSPVSKVRIPDCSMFLKGVNQSTSKFSKLMLNLWA